MKKIALAFLGVLTIAALALAGTDMSSTSHRIRRSDVNSGGSQNGASASYKLTSSAGTPGGSLFSGTTYFVYSGLANVISHPDTISTLSVNTGTSTGTIVLTWTAPAAFGSTGTATSYAVRRQGLAFTDEVSFVNATLVPQIWSPLPPGVPELRTVSGLAHNTTYYFAVKGVDAAGNTGYLSNNSAAATLTDRITGISYTNVYQSSVTLSWTGLGAGNSAGTLVQGSTVASFNAVVRSSTTPNDLQTTLTVENLRRGKLTYFRLGGLNWNGLPNFVSAGSTVTLPGPPPYNPRWTAVYTSSITLAWGGAPSDGGYTAQAYSNSAYTTLAQSSTTADVNTTTLTIVGLAANATYYLRAVSLYDDTTSYSNTTPVSTFTLAAIPTSGAFLSVAATTITVTWSGSINSAGTQFRVELSTISALGTSTATVVTSSLLTTFTGLTQDTTYWARVKALGWGGGDSDYHIIGSSIAGAITLLETPVFSGFTDVQLSSVTVSWALTGAPTIVYDVDLAPANPFAAHTTALLEAGPTATLTGLNVDALYTGRVRAHSLVTGHVSSYSNSITTSTLAMAPISLSTAGVSNTSIWLIWNGNGNPSSALYAIERSTNSVTFIQIGSVRTTNYQDQSLSGGTVYQYRVRAINETGIGTAYTNIIQIITSGSASIPRRPSGLWMERTDTGGGNFTMTYHWHRVTENTDGTSLSNLYGYEIYMSTSLLMPRAQWTLQTTVLTEDWPTTGNTSTVNYYCIKALANNGGRSDWTQIVDDSADMNHFFLFSDNRTRVQLPMEAAHKLRSERNAYGADLWMELSENASEEIGRVVRSLHVDVTNVVSGNAVTDLLFDPPVLRGILGYSVQNGQVVAGAPEPPGSPSTAKIPVISASNAAQMLSLFWFNGVEWVKTTGVVNSADASVNFTGGRTGGFQIRAATHAPGVTLTRVYPRIITPNGDGWNDKAIFQFDNPDLQALNGKVYDLTGALVASLAPGPNPDTSLSWDGKDSGGKAVPGGIYIYQIEVGGTPESGTVVVAR